MRLIWLFSHFRIQPPKHVELLIPQHAGSVLIFTPPETPRRGSAPCVDSSQLPNGHAADEDQPTVESAVHLMTTPKDFNFDAVELTLPYPYMNGEAPDLDKEAELQKMNAITDKLIESEEKYVDDLRSLAEVFSWVIEITCNAVYFRTFPPYSEQVLLSYPFLYVSYP